MRVQLRYAFPAAFAGAGLLLSLPTAVPFLKAQEAGQQYAASASNVGKGDPGSEDAQAATVKKAGPASHVSLVEAAARARQLSCISDWSDAAPIVRREGLVPMERVGRLARDQSLEIVYSALCPFEGQFVYRLRVRGATGAQRGTFRTVFVDARHPFER